MDAYRKGLLFIKGLRHDTKNGYMKASKSFNKEDFKVNLSGIVFLITGGNSGIGFQTSKEIAQRGGEVHMVCRNEARAEAARHEIVKETGNEKVYVHVLDLSIIKGVHQFVKDFLKSHKQLDVIVNNAGESVQEFKRSESENLECTFATNVVGPYALTSGLLPLLMESTNNPRVVSVGSTGMYLQRLDRFYLDKLPEKYDPIMVYSQCKRQMAVLTQLWSETHRKVHFSCMHPGWVDTPAARRGLGEFYEKLKEKFRTSAEGADTVIWLAISSSALSYPTGLFFQDRQRADRHLVLGRTKENSDDRAKFFLFVKKISDSFNNCCS